MVAATSFSALTTFLSGNTGKGGKPPAMSSSTHALSKKSVQESDGTVVRQM